MGTGCKIILTGTKGEEVYLYHTTDGYPSFQLKKLILFLEKAREIYPHWFNVNVFGSIFVAWSIGSYERPSWNVRNRIERRKRLSEKLGNSITTQELFCDIGIPEYIIVDEDFGFYSWEYRIYIDKIEVKYIPSGKVVTAPYPLPATFDLTRFAWEIENEFTEEEYET